MERHERVSELGHIAIDTLVTINLIASVMDRYPDQVQENFTEKVTSLSKTLMREMEEFQGFAEGWDETVD